MLVFSNAFNKSLIKCATFVHCLMQYSQSCGFRTQQFQNFSIPPPWLSYVTTSKYCYPCYGFLTLQFKILPTLNLEFFFWLVILLLLEIGRNYMSIITKFFGYFMPMSNGVNTKTSSSTSPDFPPPYQVFTRFVWCFTRNNLSTFVCSDQIICKRYCIF